MKTPSADPALSSEEWRSHRIMWTANGQTYACQSNAGEGPELFIGNDRVADRCTRPAAILALANDALPDSDPRKITREWVKLFRSAAIHYTTCASFDDEHPSTAECDCEGPSRAKRLADVLESYLPPE